MPDQAKCRSCNAPVIFVPSATTGRLMILDAEPVADGNVVVQDGKAAVIKRELFESGQSAVYDGPKYKDHHATCPDAASYRRKKK